MSFFASAQVFDPGADRSDLRIFLLEKGIRLLMMDFDNTIVPYTTDVPTKRMRSWLEEMNASL